MHVANLQLEGLLMAVAAINNMLVRKGILTVEEVDEALREAEASFANQRAGGMSPSNRDAVCFPIRLLLMANRGQSEDAAQSFSELARAVGQRKEA